MPDEAAESRAVRTDRPPAGRRPTSGADYLADRPARERAGSWLDGSWFDGTIEAANGLLGAAGFGLLLLDEHDRLRCVGTGGDCSELLAAMQLRSRLGPVWDALAGNRPVPVADLRTEPRYGPLAAAVAGAPVRAVLAGPLVVAGESVGGFQFHRRQPAVWSDAEVAGAVAFGRMLAALLVQMVQSKRQEAVARLRRLLGAFDVGPER